MARPIRTPRPRPADEPTLLGGLVRTFGADIERRKREATEKEDRERRQSLEDLETRGEEQRQGLERARGLRNIFGVEEFGGDIVPGTSPQPGRELEPRALGTMARGGGPGAGVRLQLEPRGEQEPSLLRERAAPTRTQFQETGLRRLEPARDPTIVNPELLPQEAEQQFDFSSFETDLGLPKDSIEEAFRRNPVGALNLIIDRAGSTLGGIPTSQLNSIRQIVQTRIQAAEASILTTLDDQEEIQLRDEVDQLTIGLLDLATGGARGAFDLDTVLDELEKLFPEDDEDSLVQRALRIQRVRKGAREFAGQVRGQLEPRQ